MLLLLLMLIFSRDPAEDFALAQGRPPVLSSLTSCLHILNDVS